MHFFIDFWRRCGKLQEMNTLLTLLLLTNLSILACILIVLFKARRIYAEFQELITPGQDQEGKPTPSPLAIVITSLADQAVRNAVGYLKASFMGKKSGESRGDDALQADIQLDLASAANPLIGQVLNGIPALRRLAKKNPGLIDLALSRMNLGGRSAAAAPTNNNGDSQAKFRL